jgi:DNA-binding FadR family transcriptional regulator
MQNSAPANATHRVDMDAILSGRIAAGTRLGEQSLFNTFSVSRTVAREALISLEALGNSVLADILLDLTARAVLFAALCQSGHDTTVSCDEHEAITNALSAGDLGWGWGADLMVVRIGNVEAALTRAKDDDPLTSLRQTQMLSKARD